MPGHVETDIDANSFRARTQRAADEGQDRASLIPAGHTALSQTRVTARDVHWCGTPARRTIVRQYQLVKGTP